MEKPNSSTANTQIQTPMNPNTHPQPQAQTLNNAPAQFIQPPLPNFNQNLTIKLDQDNSPLEEPIAQYNHCKWIGRIHRWVSPMSS